MQAFPYLIFIFDSVVLGILLILAFTIAMARLLSSLILVAFVITSEYSALIIYDELAIFSLRMRLVCVVNCSFSL